MIPCHGDDEIVYFLAIKDNVMNTILSTRKEIPVNEVQPFRKNFCLDGNVGKVLLPKSYSF